MTIRWPFVRRSEYDRVTRLFNGEREICAIHEAAIATAKSVIAKQELVIATTFATIDIYEKIVGVPQLPTAPTFPSPPS